MLKSFFRLPTGARRLIFYYSLSSIPLVAEILLPIYFFMLNWSLIEIGVLYTVAGIGNIVGSVLIGHLFDRGLQPKWAMATIDFVSGFAVLALIFARNPFDASLILFIEYVFYSFSSSYQTLEREVYPESELESAFSYHMSLPNASQIAGFLFVGYYLTFIDSSVRGFHFILAWSSILYFSSATYVLVFLPRTKKHRFEGLTFSRIPKKLMGFALAELIMILAYSIVPEFIFLNIVFNLTTFTVLEICLTRIPADVAGVVGAILATKFDSNLKGILSSIPLIALSHILVYTLILDLTHFIALTIVALFTFISYCFHTVWFVHHRSVFYRDTPEDIKGTIFGAMTSSRIIISMISVPIATAIALYDPFANFIVAGIIMFSVMPIYMLSIRSEQSL